MWQPIDTADKTLSVGCRSKIIFGCDAKGRVSETFWQEHKDRGEGWLMCGDNVDRLYLWEPILWVEIPPPLRDAKLARGHSL
jgi:hypothetical protein